MRGRSIAWRCWIKTCGIEPYREIRISGFCSALAIPTSKEQKCEDKDASDRRLMKQSFDSSAVVISCCQTGPVWI